MRHWRLCRQSTSPLRSLSRVLGLLPGWCEALRASTVKKLLQSTRSALENIVSSYKKQVESLEDLDEGERQKFLHVLQRSSDAMMLLAKSLHAKEPALVALSNQARELATSASTAHRQQTYSEALEAFILHGDAYGKEGSPARGAEKRVIEVVAAAQSCALTKNLTELCEKGVICVAVKVLKSTQDEIDLKDFEHFHSLLTTGQRLHRLLGTAADAPLRQCCMEMASVHLQLKEFLIKAERTEAFMKKHGDKVLQESLHLSSLLQRCEEVVAKSTEESQTVDAQESLGMLSKFTFDVVDEGLTFRKVLAEAVHAETTKIAQGNLATYTTLVGDRRNAQAQPLWSVKLTRESTWQEVQAEAKKSLQREGYGEKVKALIAKVVVDRLGHEEQSELFKVPQTSRSDLHRRRLCLTPRSV